MSLFNIFNISGSALAAQSVRLNSISSNLANADTVATTPEQAYRARYPIFQPDFNSLLEEESAVGVRVNGMSLSKEPARQEYMPSHPLADADGFIYRSNVNSVEEMVNMVSASRSYQSNIEAMNTTKQLLMRTINIGR